MRTLSIGQASGVCFLSSDAITTRLKHKAAQVRLEIPRGWYPRIADRFDLTLVCIRRHYLGERANPLGEVFHRYADFFALFGDFSGYVSFFLLQHLVEEDGESIRFFHPFDDFRTPAVLKTWSGYLAYLQFSEAFRTARSRSIDAEP